MGVYSKGPYLVWVYDVPLLPRVAYHSLQSVAIFVATSCRLVYQDYVLGKSFPPDYLRVELEKNTLVKSHVPVAGETHLFASQIPLQH